MARAVDYNWRDASVFQLLLPVSKISSKHDLPKHLRTNRNHVCCQTILDHWTFYQEVLGTTGALSNFRGVTVWSRGLWQELLRGRESIRQGSLQSGHLLKMQQHHYSLTQPTTSASFTASLFISLWIFISLFLWVLFAAAICSLSDISHSTLLHIPFFSSILPILSPSSTYFLLLNWQGWASLTPSCMRWPTEAFSLLFSTAPVSVRYCTGTRIEQPTENNKWTYMGG